MMKRSILILLIAVMVSFSVSAQKKSKAIEMKTPSDSLSYSFGMLIGINMKTQGVKDVNSEILLKGFENGYAGVNMALTQEQANKIVQDYFNNLVKGEADSNLKACKSFLEENKTKEGVVTLPSGLQYKVLEKGEGPSPLPTDQVKVHYTGSLINGTVFDSSIERGEPAVFGVNQVIPGWTEALQLMSTGSRWMLYIPTELAYGENGAGGVIGPNQALIFEVQLIEINPK